MARILVIDDDDDVREFLQSLLEREGYEVEEAEDGKIGIEKFRKNPADLVILDIIMPNQEGIETITSLKQSFPDVKIFAISGGGAGGRIDFLPAARKLGALQTFSKPFDLRRLLDAVSEVIGQS